MWGAAAFILPVSHKAVVFSPTCCFPGYQIAYRLDSGDPKQFTTIEVGPDILQFTAAGLHPESAYIFRISAKTQQGWGTAAQAVVITTEIRGDHLVHFMSFLIALFT